MSKLALLALLSPALAFASDCEHAQPRTLDLDLSGVREVRIEVNSHELRLAPARDGKASFTARACASDPALFDQLKFTQERQGDVLVVRAERDGYSSGDLLQGQLRDPAARRAAAGDAGLRGARGFGRCPDFRAAERAPGRGLGRCRGPRRHRRVAAEGRFG